MATATTAIATFVGSKMNDFMCVFVILSFPHQDSAVQLSNALGNRNCSFLFFLPCQDKCINCIKGMYLLRRLLWFWNVKNCLVSVQIYFMTKFLSWLLWVGIEIGLSEKSHKVPIQRWGCFVFSTLVLYNLRHPQHFLISAGSVKRLYVKHCLTQKYHCLIE